jgi:hypothetical protein
MATFTTIMERGHKKFIDQNLKKRIFGDCENCSGFHLLISTTLLSVKTNEKMEIKICEECYNTILFGSEK